MRRQNPAYSPIQTLLINSKNSVSMIRKGRLVSFLYKDIFDDVASRLDLEVNPYVRDIIQGQTDGDLPVTYGPALKGMKENWHQKFSKESKTNPLVLEIGCHKGKTIREMASNRPELNFIGMDITFKRVVMTAQRAQNANLENVTVMLGSAKQMELIFGDSELDGIIIFFPDPWSKPRQASNRLVQEDFCKLMRKIIKPGGFFWFKTDQKPYFDHTCQFVDTVGFVEDPNPTGLCSDIYETTFERKFKNVGLPTYEKVWVNPSN